MKEVYVLLEGYTDSFDNQYFRYIGVFSTIEEAVKKAKESDNKINDYNIEMYDHVTSFIEEGWIYFTAWKIIKSKIQ